MPENKVTELPDDQAAKTKADTPKSLAEDESAKEPVAKDAVEVEGPKAELRAMSEDPSKQGLKQTESQQVSMKTNHEINWQKWGAIAGILTFLIAAPAYMIGYIGYTKVSGRIEGVKRQILADQFVISTPTDGASVSFTDLVRGRTPFSQDMNHYVVVTTGQGSDWVQDIPATVAGGTFAGSARFGEANTSAGEGYIVRVFATASRLQPGPLTIVPEDAIFSEPVTVKRK